MLGANRPPVGFDKRHFALAADFGISRCRIIFVENSEGMRRKARALGVADNETAAYDSNVWALRVQRDDLPKGPDVFILLRGPLEPDLHERTYRRLESQDLNPSLRIAASGEPELLYGFLLLHEVAHHVLGHGKAESPTQSEQQEHEADSWAWAELRRSWSLFPEPVRPFGAV